VTEHPIVEACSDPLHGGHPCHRYWIPGGFFIMVGGSLLGPDDWDDLQRDYGITHVLNVGADHDDAGKVPNDRLCQVRVPDDGTPFRPEAVLAACLFVAERVANAPVGKDPKFYVHCQVGSSRGPAFAYALMRGVFELSPEEALGAVRAAHKTDYGDHEFHKVYMASIESALAPIVGGR
jgi:hypothetical protein